MSNDKLQASDIAGFAANGLKVKHLLSNKPCEVVGLYKDLITVNGYWTNSQTPHEGDVNINEVIPLIYNPDILTQTITFRGKQVCHLIELAKIAFPEYKNWYIENGIAKAKGLRIGFLFMDSSFMAYDTQTQNSFNVYNQAALIAYLNRALVDYMGLIERGLAEAVDLNNNPYK